MNARFDVRSRWVVAWLLALVASAVAALVPVSAEAAGGPILAIKLMPDADYFIPGESEGTAAYTIEVENVGTAPTTNSEQLVIKDFLPSGVSAEEVKLYEPSLSGLQDLAPSMCPKLTRCEYPGTLTEPTLQPGQKLVMQVRVQVPAETSGPLTDFATAAGGGAAPVEAGGTNEASAGPVFGFERFQTLLNGSANMPYTQAGGHPNALMTDFRFTTKTPGESALTGEWGLYGSVPVQDPRTIAAELPPGLVGDPQGVPHCSLADFFSHNCPISAAVGMVGFRAFGTSQGAAKVLTALWNLQPSAEYPGELGFYAGFPFLLTAGVRTGFDYGLNITDSSLPEIGLDRTRVITWGVPANPSHDALRGKTCGGSSAGGQWNAVFVQSYERVLQSCEEEEGSGEFAGGPAETEERPFLTLPTSCSGQPLSFTARVVSWQIPEESIEALDETPAVDGCNQLSFPATIQSRLTTNVADSPSGLEFDLHVPQSSDPEGVATANLREAVVTLPEKVTVNPSSANGLGACAPPQIGLLTPPASAPARFAATPAQCPDGSKLGTVEVDTPLLHEPLTGSIYLATPRQNPAGSLLAAYIVLEGQGVIVKLPGEIEANAESGQLTARFLENPQLPFEDFKLRFFEGAKGALRTPPSCGTYQTTSVLTPWSAPESGPPAEPSSTFETTVGAGGGPCPQSSAEMPAVVKFAAGTESAQAGAFTPFAFKLGRDDGSQELGRIETVLPPGLIGRLAGVTECSEGAIAAARSREHEGGGAEEENNPSCPASSEVGKVQIAAGAGPTPLYVNGRAYLAGPYRGAPLSLAIITPAVAGPFDLGTVVVRTALYVDPETARIKALSDQIPHIRQGIPLDVRTITLKLDRPNFTLNPTNCEELAFGGAATTISGALVPLSQRFQVGGCPALPFKPKLSLQLKGGTKRSDTPALKATLAMPPGDANIAFAQVTLPRSELLAQAHLENICTRVQFSEGACPPSSVYGHAIAYTPLLDQPLEGPVYLRSNPAHKLPDLAVDLNGQIQIVLASKVDAVHASLRNTFEVVPDAPVSKFVLQMKGGKHSLIENEFDICRHPQRFTALFKGQNGKSVELTPKLKTSCKAKHRHRSKHRPRH